jgi:radical S-adenosyl methionine domain-containing protein 2
MKSIAPSINYHLTKSCNMRCKFCFATFNDLGFVKHDVNQSIRLIESFAKAGFEKLTFAGGEPTLVKELPQLLKVAKQNGLVTTVVTNALKLSQPEIFDGIAANSDWIALSIDSVNVESNLKSGRALVGRTALTDEYYLDIIEKIKLSSIKLKINTVVSSFNHTENLTDFILKAAPDRWKILQAIAVEGQNSGNQFEISEKQFNEFTARHSKALSNLVIVPEGRFFDSSKGAHTYSDKILEVGLSKALSQVHFDLNKFQKRGGVYDWSNLKSIFKPS